MVTVASPLSHPKLDLPTADLRTHSLGCPLPDARVMTESACRGCTTLHAQLLRCTDWIRAHCSNPEELIHELKTGRPLPATPEDTRSSIVPTRRRSASSSGRSHHPVARRQTWPAKQPTPAPQTTRLKSALRRSCLKRERSLCLKLDAGLTLAKFEGVDSKAARSAGLFFGLDIGGTLSKVQLPG